MLDVVMRGKQKTSRAAGGITDALPRLWAYDIKERNGQVGVPR
jgi:hypothetical protein